MSGIAVIGPQALKRLLALSVLENASTFALINVGADRFHHARFSRYQCTVFSMRSRTFRGRLPGLRGFSMRRFGSEVVARSVGDETDEALVIRANDQSLH